MKKMWPQAHDPDGFTCHDLRMLEKGVEIHVLVAEENQNMIESAAWRRLLEKIRVIRMQLEPAPPVCQHFTGTCPWCRDDDDAA